jgi:ABC-2 type transport system ATP-binding protein
VSGAIVQAEGLTKKFGEFVAVDQVDFEVQTGEIFGFLGPNGAGKTTTIKMLTGLIPPTSGRGEVAGLDVALHSQALKSRIGYMSQLFSLYSDLTVEENITFFSRLYNVPPEEREKRKNWVLEMAGLEAQRTFLTAELPLGWKQRLALGCAVLHRPPVLFLDEPTSGVDPMARRRFWDLIYLLAAEGTTVFVTTHYMEEAENCHRLALMNRGKLIALDTPRALREGMTEPILQVETSDSPRAVAALEGAPGVIDAALFGRALHVSVTDATQAVQAITDQLAERSISVSGVRQGTPSREDICEARVREAGGSTDD